MKHSATLFLNDFANVFPKHVDMNSGRPGMDLWSVFVLATIRLNLNTNYDSVLALANNHNPPS
ncbi:MAG: hypothetical protein ACI9FJ_002946, partial [Alteromonadaceae bacterium]